MNDTDKLVSEVLRRHNGDPKGAIAWFIGYTGSLEKDLNAVRVAAKAEPQVTLIENLKEAIVSINK